MTLEWRKNGVLIPNATSEYFSRSNVTVADSGVYTLTAINLAGSATTSGIVVTVSEPSAPELYNLPLTLVVPSGESLSLYPLIRGTQPMTYQWWKDGVIILDATGSSFGKSNVSAADAGQYWMTAQNQVGSATSTKVTVLVDNPVAPSIFGLPDSVVLSYGDYLSLSPNVLGSNPRSYVWKKDGVVVNGSSSSSGSYYKSPVTLTDSGNYTLTVSNAAGATTSRPVAVSVNPAIAPQILGMPAFITVDTASAFSITPTISGTSPINCTWRKDGVLRSSGSSNSYYKSNVTEADAGSYQVVATNIAGVATSSITVVTVNPAEAPKVYNLPAAVLVKYGETMSLSPTVSGTAPLYYQWKKDGVALTRGQSNNFYVSMVTLADAGVYTLTVTNAVGATTSAGVTVTVLDPVAPSIYGLPTTRIVAFGGYLSLYPTTSGTQPMTYQWLRDGTEIVGAINETYSRSSVTTSDSGQYTLVATNLVGSATSTPVTVIVNEAEAPAIYNFPGSQTVAYGSYFTMSATVAGTQPISYQWYRNGQVIPDATSYYYYRSYVTTDDAGEYTLSVTNALGTATSPAATLVVLPAVPPVATEQPVPIYAAVTQTARFQSQFTGTAPISYQWYFNDAAIPQATASVLNVENLTPAHYGRYHVVASNPGGSSNSAVVTLAPDSGLAVDVIAAGNGTSYWTRHDRSLWAAGSNYHGQLGDGTRSARPNARLIAADIRAIAGGEGHSLFVKADGTLWSVGLNDSGQLGNGTMNMEVLPVQVANDVAQVAANVTHSFFIKTDHSLWAMGLNNYGMLGDDTTQSRYLPVQVATDVAKVAPGYWHTAILKRDGTLWTSGMNSFGQLGDGTNSTRSSFGQIATNILDVAAGYMHTLYLAADHTLWAVGTNDYGQLGDGTFVDKPNPVPVAYDVQAVAAGFRSTYFIKTDMTLWAMGENSYGQLGDGSTQNRNLPVQIATDVEKIAVGRNHAIIVLTDGSMWGFGQTGDQGAFGDGRTGRYWTRPLQLTWRTATRPMITQHPLGQVVTRGATVSLSVAADSPLPLSYQWRREAVPLDGAVNASLLLPDFDAGLAGNYDVLVTNAEGSVVSNAAVLTLMTGYDNWAAANFSTTELTDPSVSGPDANPDGDGYHNLMEYALSLDPMAAGSSPELVLTTDATHWIFSFERSADRAELIYSVEVSNDLTQWHAPAIAPVRVGTNGDKETWQAKEPLTSGTVFFRLKVTQE